MSGIEADTDLEGLLVYIRDARGFDFTAYRRPSLARRIGKRMGDLGIERVRDYQDHLEANPHEFVALFDSLLINVTSFFRDKESWQHLADEVVPSVLASKRDGEQIRVWSAGCASGEEPYSIAVILREALGPAEFEDRVKIYATDVDERALAQGRAGSYPASKLDDMPAEMRERYFTGDAEKVPVVPEIRHAVVFGRHDLLQDPSLSHIDLLLCRNVIIYFKREAQAEVVARFHAATNEPGFLFLGRSEMLFSSAHLFAPESIRHRVFRKVGVASDTPARRAEPSSALDERLHDRAIDSTLAAQIVIDHDDVVVLVNEEARRMFGLDRRDVGRPLRDLEISYRPVDLRSAIDEVHAEGRVVWIGGIERRLAAGSSQLVDVTIAPVRDDDGNGLGTIITFTDVTDETTLRDDLERARRELEVAYEELRATNEEVESTNEELHSTVEELDTTNQELQATNEELETMNEELQSTNEELRAVNDQLRDRTDDLNQTSQFTDAIFSGMDTALVAVDSDMVVHTWTARAAETWGPRPEDVLGSPLASVDCGLPVEDLVALLDACLTSGEAAGPMDLNTIDRVGNPAPTRVRVLPVMIPGGTKGAALVFEIIA